MPTTHGRGSGERKSDEIGLPRLGSPDGPAQPIHACDIEESIRREASTMRAPVGLQVAVSRLVFVDRCGEASDALEAQLLDTVQTLIENLEKVGIGEFTHFSKILTFEINECSTGLQYFLSLSTALYSF